MEPTQDPEALFDYDPITPTDTRSFEEDGQEGSLQDALDLGDPNAITEPIIGLATSNLPDNQTTLHSIHATQSSESHRESLNSSTAFKPGIQHGAFTCPPPGTSPPASSKFHSPSKHLSPLRRPSHSSKSPKMSRPQSSTNQTSSSASDHYLSAHQSDSTVRRSKPLPLQARQSRELPPALLPIGSAVLPSRLSGWFQQAFSSSNSNLPLLNPAPAPQISPRSPEKFKFNYSAKKIHPMGQATPPEDQTSPRSVLPEPKRSPGGGSHSTSSNIRGLGNFFDKAVNYMFDTDAHSYDSRLTADMWIIGGQQFSGVWKWQEVHHDEASYEDYGPPHANGGTGSGSDVSHTAPLPLKKRSGLRRVTVDKTKAMFKHHNHHSSVNHVRRSIDLSISSRKNNHPPTSSSSTPSPEPSPAMNPSYHRDHEAISIPSSVTHAYPPIFFHAFASIIGLTYRTDFPPIPCASDRSKSSGLGAAGARVGGMLASLSLSIGRTGKKPRSGQGGSRSPSPNPLSAERFDERDRATDANMCKGLTSDVGWGCMLRTGQSLLANALLVVHLGRDWRRPVTSILNSTSSAAVDPLYARLLSWFIDSSSPLAPFSVHRFASKGKELGKEVGEWFGPSTAAGAIKALTNEFLPAGLGVATDVDGTVYRSDVCNASMGPVRSSSSTSAKNPWLKPVLVLVNVRLGLDGVNPAYYEAIKATFTFLQSVGIAGGRPSSSYYFCGHQGDSLFYIDPHHSRPAIPLEDPPASLMLTAQKLSLNARTLNGKSDGDWEQISSTDTDSVLSGSGGSEALAWQSKAGRPTKNADKISFQTRYSSSISVSLRREQLEDFYAGAYPDSALRTFHPDKVRRMNLSSLDPSMLLGFIVKDENDWDDLTSRIRSFKPPLFHIADVTPAWMRPTVDTTNSRDSTDFKPSDDSDLGVDSWSEPEDWGNSGPSSSGPHSRSIETDEQDEDSIDDCPADDAAEFSAQVDSMSIEDEGWDDVDDAPATADQQSTPALASNSGKIVPEHDLHRSSPQNSLEFVIPPRMSSKNIMSHARASSVNAQQAFPRGPEVIRPIKNTHRHSLSYSEVDDQERAETIRYLNPSALKPEPLRKPPVTTPSSVFPTSQTMPSSSSSPTPNPLDEPRARNVSAATVRARQSDDQLADNEEALNHGQRRRLDSQGSSRALRV